MNRRGPFLIRTAKPASVNLDALAKMGTAAVAKLYREMFGREAPAGNTEHARRRIAWQVQAEREGGLPESARQHALGIARDLVPRSETNGKRSTGPSVSSRLPSTHDSRIPMPGSVLVKEYRGRRVLVRVLVSGFEWEGQRFASLSAVARAITGTKWNGLLFFGLTKGRGGGSAK